LAYPLVRKSDQRNLMIIDARSPAAYYRGHLEGAIHLDPYSLKFNTLIQKIPANTSLLVYCRTFKRSGLVCRHLHENGFQKILQISDGYTGWTQNNLPVFKP
jgi:rhodanese-related sulfurtransferase